MLRSLTPRKKLFTICHCWCSQTVLCGLHRASPGQHSRATWNVTYLHLDPLICWASLCNCNAPPWVLYAANFSPLETRVLSGSQPQTHVNCRTVIITKNGLHRIGRGLLRRARRSVIRAAVDISMLQFSNDCSIGTAKCALAHQIMPLLVVALDDCGVLVQGGKMAAQYDGSVQAEGRSLEFKEVSLHFQQPMVLLYGGAWCSILGCHLRKL